MNMHMTKQEILSVLTRVGKADLSIPESKKQAILSNPSLQKYLASLEETAAKHRGTPIPVLPYSNFKLFWETGNRSKFEGDKVNGYFPRRGRMAAFALTSWLYGKEEDIHELEDVLWAVCDEYTWSLPAHLKRGEGENAFIDKLENGDYMVDLFASETADALSEIVFLVGDKLAPIVKKRIAYLVEERVFQQVINETYGWMSTKSNWAAVCAGSVGMAAIRAIDDDAHLAEVLERILPAFDTFLQSFSADGACLEGIGYWDYGFSYFVSFADLLCQRTKGELNLFEEPIVAKIAAFQQKCFFKGGRTVSFSDGGSRGIYHPGLASYLSRKFDDVMLPPACAMGDFNMDRCYRWSNNLRDLLWTEDTSNIPEVYGCYPLEDAQWFIGSGAGDVSLAAKAGHNAEPHNHNDVGSFLIFKNGEELFCDPGSGEYTRQYFSEIRYTIFVAGSQGHSVPMIDGNMQKGGREYAASDVIVNDTGISMNMAGAYGLDYMPALKRDVAFDKTTGVTTVTDAYTFTDGAHEVHERFMTRGEITLGEGSATVKMGNEIMTMTFDPAFTVTTMSAQNRRGETETGTIKYDIIHVIDLAMKMEGETTVTFTFAP